MLVKYDLTQFSKGTKISSAKLELYVEGQPRKGSATSNLYTASKEWKEMEANWFKASKEEWWSNEGGDYDPGIKASFDFPSNAVGKWHDFDVTELVQGFIDNPETNFGFHFFMSVAMVTLEYTSSESPNKGNRPKLILDIATGIQSNTIVSKEQVRIVKTNSSYQFFVPFSNTSEITMYGMNGKQLVAITTHGTQKWYQLPGIINNGVYLLRIAHGGKNSVQKIWLTR